ncbi:DNA-formamidopyrimidine glycosylase family protein [Amnibacterium sp. CER49]|uniref:Fpg/Nei family DNA glycosylase n=1 Tax=Amnibacterium sp. CER49 TaxID=3039161 RepID=UPI00244CA98F|nr:DNA glycosylase [Amnibacterium sp. CER49]MDH2442542.1 DNA-formamidopyrimidine glycosylase family protein [Amnibacterium sp. CER49]
MPEGHSLHRIALQFRRNFVGHRAAASSPQGRFAAGAALLDGRVMVASSAVGKHLLLEFEGERTLHVHLGLYGAWDFAGEITADATLASANGRMGQTNQRGTFLDQIAGDTIDPSAETPDGLEAAADGGVVADALPESSLGSIGAPRRTRLRMAESERGEDVELTEFPPEPIGQVRLRLLIDTAVADLRGPTACEVFDPDQVRRLIAKLGPDPMHDSGKAAEDRFVAAVRKSGSPIGLLLMDQSVVAGIGNVYRAELLFRARLNPHTPGKEISVPALRKLWRDWAHLLAIGVRTGQMMTRDDLETEEQYRNALASRDERHFVYKRTGQKSPRGRGEVVMEEMGGRNLYWAPGWQTLPRPKRD